MGTNSRSKLGTMLQRTTIRSVTVASLPAFEFNLPLWPYVHEINDLFDVLQMTSLLFPYDLHFVPCSKTHQLTYGAYARMNALETYADLRRCEIYSITPEARVTQDCARYLHD